MVKEILNERGRLLFVVAEFSDTRANSPADILLQLPCRLIISHQNVYKSISVDALIANDDSAKVSNRCFAWGKEPRVLVWSEGMRFRLRIDLEA